MEKFAIKKPILIAAIQWFVTTLLQVDRLFFTYEHETKYLLVVKLCYFGFLAITWYFIFEARKKLKASNQVWKRGFFIFKVYFLLMMFFLLIVWPGTWAWDDLNTLNKISTYEGWNPWQHILTGIYQDILLQILPFPGGIILLQNVIISVCVAFVVTKLESSFDIGRLRNPVIDSMVKLFPFFTPPLLLYQFSGYRMGMYVYLELVVLVMLICAWKEPVTWSWTQLLLFSALSVIIASWRTESFFYVPGIGLLVLFVKNTVLTPPKKDLLFAHVRDWVFRYYCDSKSRAWEFKLYHHIPNETLCRVGSGGR